MPGIARLLVVIALVASAGAAAAQAVPARLNQPLPGAGLDQALFNEAVLLFSNAARRQHGRAPLAPDPALARAATVHAQNMARLRQHSHVLPVRGQGKLQQRMKSQQVRYRLAAENIAMDKVYRLLGRPISTGAQGCRFVYADTRGAVPVHTYASLAQQAVARWMASPKHRDSLLSQRFARLGSGASIDPDGAACGDVYLVQTFAD